MKYAEMKWPYYLSSAAAGGLMAVFFFSATAMASDCHSPVSAKDMILTFDDEFKGNVLNKKVWNVHPRHIGAINGEVQEYVPDAYEMAPEGGIKLRADKKDFHGKHFTSGEITTAGAFSQTYGHFEMKAKMPGVDGAWPAFWLLPEDGKWPPEIDVLEYIYQPWGKPVGNANRSYAHFGVFWDPNLPTVIWKPIQNNSYNSNSGVYLTDNYRKQPEKPPQFEGDFTKAFHIYAVDWRPRELSFSVDGVERMCWTEGADTIGSVPNVPMYMIANLALSKAAPDPAGWPGRIEPDQQFPFYMDIAYIKAYQFKDAPKVSPSPLVIGIPSLSAETVKPGDVLTITTDLRVGDKALPSVDTQMSINDFDGRGGFAKAAFKSPRELAAHSHYPITMHYAVPDDLEPGIYTVYIRSSWPGGAVENNLATEFTVTEGKE